MEYQNERLRRARAELEKEEKRLQIQQSRTEERRKQVEKLENSAVLGLVDACNLTPEQLADLLHGLLPQQQQKPAAKKQIKTEQTRKEQKEEQTNEYLDEGTIGGRI